MSKKFNNYEDLKKHIGADEIYSTYAENELSSYLENIGSNTGSFELEIDEKKYEITVRSFEIDENTFNYEYILLNE